MYELTAYGCELEDIVLRLGRWGAQRLGEPAPNEILTVDSMIIAMRSTFQPEAARHLDVSYELRLGDITIHVRIDDAGLRVVSGPLPEADLVIETGPAIKTLMTGELRPAEALANRSVVITGDPALLDRFVALFHI